MRITTLFIATLLASLIALGTTAQAQVKNDYAIDKEHSSIIFKVKNRDVSYVYGRFNDISGSLITDQKYNPNSLMINVDVNARSVDTNSKKRDRHLKGRDFFDTATFKAIKFETKECKKLEEMGKYELTGELTVLGKKSPLTVVFELTGAKDLPGGLHRIGGEASFTLKRSALGLDYMPEEIADDVLIMVNFEGQMKAPPLG